jgi:hypothetical protein
MPPHGRGTSLARRTIMATRMQTLPGTFSDDEEEFFRAGMAMSEVEPVDTFADLDADYEPPSLWERIFGRHSATR